MLVVVAINYLSGQKVSQAHVFNVLTDPIRRKNYIYFSVKVLSSLPLLRCSLRGLDLWVVAPS